MSVFLVMVLEEEDSLRLTNLNFPTQSALDMRSLLARVDVLFYWSGIPMFHTSREIINENWFEFEKSGIKL